MHKVFEMDPKRSIAQSLTHRRFQFRRQIQKRLPQDKPFRLTTINGCVRATNDFYTNAE
jgi:hypothetical protein